MRQDAAFQVGAQLLLDMARQLLLGRARALQEGLQMLGEDLVQRMLFWLTAAVWTRLGRGTGDRYGAGQAATCGPLGEGRASGGAMACLWSTN